MRNTTLCYIEREQQYLMLHRVKKENDLNHDKWVGIGGKFEGNETPDECLLREAYEETGLTLNDWRCRGVVTFLSDTWEGEYMYLFTAGGFTGTLRECNEGVLSWVDKAAVPALPMWEGDKIFFRLLAEDAPFFLLKLRYEGDTLVEAALNGAPVYGKKCYERRFIRLHQPYSNICNRIPYWIFVQRESHKDNTQKLAFYPFNIHIGYVFSISE